jgi:hypothetical protein
LSISFHISTCLSSMLSISYHYSNYISSIFPRSFHYSTYLSNVFQLSETNINSYDISFMYKRPWYNCNIVDTT